MDASMWSTVAAVDAWEDILDATVAALYDKYLTGLHLQYAVARVLADTTAAVNSKLPQLDVLLDQHRPPEARPTRFTEEDATALEGAGSWVAEEEATPGAMDSWAQARVPLRTSGVRRPPPVALAAEAAPAAGGRKGGPASSASQLHGSGALPKGAALAPAPSLLATAVSEEGSRKRGGGKGSPAPAPSSRKPTAPPALAHAATATPAAAAAATTAPLAATGARGAATAGADATKRAAAASKSLAGKQITLDERGHPVVVIAPTAGRLPTMELPVSALVEGAPASLGQSVVTALKTAAAAQVVAAPSRKADIPRPAPPPAAAPAPSDGVAMKRAGDTGHYFRRQPGVQPSLVDSLHATGALATGVTVSEAGGKSAAGPPPPSGISVAEFERTRKAKFSGSSTLRTMRAPPLPGGGSGSAAGGGAPSAAAPAPSGAGASGAAGAGASGSAALASVTGMVDSLDVALRATRFTPLPSGAAPANLLASIPDVVSRSASTPLQAAASIMMRDSAGDLPLVSPKPGSGLLFRPAPGLAGGGSARRTQSPLGAGGAPPLDVTGGGGTRAAPSAASMPADEPALTHKQRVFAVGDVSRRPRDRATGGAATGPRAHLPPPPFPATSHFDPLSRPSVASGDGPGDDDMLVVDGSVDGDGSGTLNEFGVMVPSRFAAVSPLSDPRGSKATSPVRDSSPPPRGGAGSPPGAVLPPAKEWGATARRREGGRVRIGSDGVMAAGRRR